VNSRRNMVLEKKNGTRLVNLSTNDSKMKNIANKKMCKDKWNYINGNYN